MHIVWLAVVLLPASIGSAAAEAGGPEFWYERYRVLRDPAALAKCIDLSRESAGFAQQLVRAQCLLAAGRTAESIRMAEALNRAAPDALDAYGLLAEAYLAAGRAPEAEKAAQWMLDLRVEDPRSLRAAALVREHLGDIDGAIDLLADALRRIPRARSLERAEALNSLGALLRRAERDREAEMAGAAARQIMDPLQQAFQERTKQ